jgi:hypothetical protein
MGKGMKAAEEIADIRKCNLLTAISFCTKVQQQVGGIGYREIKDAVKRAKNPQACSIQEVVKLLTTTRKTQKHEPFQPIKKASPSKQRPQTPLREDVEAFDKRVAKLSENPIPRPQKEKQSQNRAKPAKQQPKTKHVSPKPQSKRNQVEPHASKLPTDKVLLMSKCSICSCQLRVDELETHLREVHSIDQIILKSRRGHRRPHKEPCMAATPFSSFISDCHGLQNQTSTLHGRTI